MFYTNNISQNVEEKRTRERMVHCEGEGKRKTVLISKDSRSDFRLEPRTENMSDDWKIGSFGKKKN